MRFLARRLEHGGVLSGAGVCQAAQPFLAVLLQNLFPRRPLVLVAPDLKTQESFQQDIETWLSVGRETRDESRGQKPPGESGRRPSTPDPRPLFYPAWEILPHEGKLPHADVISDRLQTLVALSGQPVTHHPQSATRRHQRHRPAAKNLSARRNPKAHAHGWDAADKIAPLDLIEWLEEQGYEPEAQVSQKGEIALRGGILDVFPPTSPVAGAAGIFRR